jgi:hypothetical protein
MYLFIMKGSFQIHKRISTNNTPVFKELGRYLQRYRLCTKKAGCPELRECPPLGLSPIGGKNEGALG